MVEVYIDSGKVLPKHIDLKGRLLLCYIHLSHEDFNIKLLQEYLFKSLLILIFSTLKNFSLKNANCKRDGCVAIVDGTCRVYSKLLAFVGSVCSCSCKHLNVTSSCDFGFS